VGTENKRNECGISVGTGQGNRPLAVTVLERENDKKDNVVNLGNGEGGNGQEETCSQGPLMNFREHDSELGFVEYLCAGHTVV
jgi:hypothetical protein